MPQPTLIAENVPYALRVYQTWDESGGVFELWKDADCTQWIACADDRADAARIAAYWITERLEAW